MSKSASWSREEAMERFVRKYSNGFTDAWYRSSHRDARLAQHKLFHELLPDARIRELAADGPHIAAQHIIRVLEAVKWNKKEAAKVLGISRGTLYRKIDEYELAADRDQPSADEPA